MNPKTSPAAALLVLSLTTVVRAGTLDVPADYPTIQAAIDAAVTGDVVLVAPGTYIEHIDFKGKAIIVRSSGGRTVTRIQGIGNDNELPLVTFATGEGRASVIEGFEITGGRGHGIYSGGASPVITSNDIHDNRTLEDGAGIFCHAGAPLIEANLIRSNVTTADIYTGYAGSGGGIQCDASSAIITGNEIAKNQGQHGGGIRCNGGFDVIERNWIHDNGSNGFGGGIEITGDSRALVQDNLVEINGAEGGGGIAIYGSSQPLVEGNVVRGNYASGFYTYSGWGAGIAAHEFSQARIIGNLIVGNFALGYDPVGGGVSCKDCSLIANTIVGNFATGGLGGGAFVDHAVVANCIIWGNTTGGSFADFKQLNGTVATYSDIGGGFAGEGNIDADPLLVDRTGGDYRLSSSSPCIDIGDPALSCLETDLHGTPRVLDGDLDLAPRADMGALEYTHLAASVTGTPAPGQTLTFLTSGTPGLHVILLVGTAPGAACAWPFGALLMNPASLALIVPWGTIPGTGELVRDVVIPGGISGPLTIELQQLGMDGGSGAGGLSNLMELTFP